MSYIIAALKLILPVSNADSYLFRDTQTTSKQEAGFAFIMNVTKYDGRKFKIGVPSGMTVGELEAELHEKYWTVRP